MSQPLYVGCRIETVQGMFLRPIRFSHLVTPVTKIKLYDVFTNDRLNVLLDQDSTETATIRFVVKVDAIIINEMSPHMTVLSDGKRIAGSVPSSIMDTVHCFCGVDNGHHLAVDWCVGCNGFIAADDNIERCELCKMVAHEQCSILVRQRPCAESFRASLPLRTLLFTPPATYCSKGR